MLRLNEATAYIKTQTTSHPTDAFPNQFNLFLHFNFKIQNYVFYLKKREIHTQN